MTLMNRIRILPMLVIVAMLCFAVRLGEVVSFVGDHGSAYAEEAVEEVDTDVPSLSENDMADAAEQAGEKIPVEASSKNDAGESVDLPDVEWRDASDSEFEYSTVKEDLYKDLIKRRETLEKKEKELAIREALLEAGERELDQKLREMTNMRNEMKNLMSELSTEEKQRIDSLVKIYEGMKAKDAAAIFNTLDMDILIKIFANMSERKSSPILAEMAPERARTVTILLAQQKKVPTLLGQ